VDDLVEWLRAQLDEDERIARAAAREGGPAWQYDGHAVLTRREGDLVAVGSQDFLELERGNHIAAHDPARVLRETAAKRRMVEAYERTSHGERTAPHDDMRDVARAKVDSWRFALRLLALSYGDRSGYREEWRL